jgi:hypothetical protein
MATLSFTPDLGFADFDSNFVLASNPLLVSVDTATLVPIAGPEGAAKSFSEFKLLINNTVFTIPVSVRRKIRAKNGGFVYWRTSDGASGSFRYFREAPAVA